MANVVKQPSAGPETVTARQGQDSLVSGRRLLLAIALAIGLAVPVGMATPPTLSAVAPSWGQIDQLAAVITAEVYLAIILAHLLAFGGLSGLRYRLRLGRTSVRDLGVAFAAWVGVWVAAGLVYLALSPALRWLDDIGDTLLWIGSDGGRLAYAGPALLTVALVRACLLAPLGEELLFRGALFGWLRRRLNATVAIASTAALFAIIHPLPVVWPLTFLFGVGAGWVRERTGSTTPFLVMHVLNSVAMITVAYLVSGWDVPVSS
jgi:membrane protease YdiL (CAAX protease family)